MNSLNLVALFTLIILTSLVLHYFFYCSEFSFNSLKFLFRLYIYHRLDHLYFPAANSHRRQLHYRFHEFLRSSEFHDKNGKSAGEGQKVFPYKIGSPSATEKLKRKIHERVTLPGKNCQSRQNSHGSRSFPGVPLPVDSVAMQEADMTGRRVY